MALSFTVVVVGAHPPFGSDTFHPGESGPEQYINPPPPLALGGFAGVGGTTTVGGTAAGGTLGLCPEWPP